MEKGWNSIYRQGANITNVNETSNTSALELLISPPTKNHIVVGGDIETARRDIQFGTFRSWLRSPKPSSGGSALSMIIQYNETENIEMDMLNTDKPENARITTLIEREFPNQNLGVNYSTIAQNGSKTMSAINPWDFLELRIDWTAEIINFYVAGNLTRSIDKSNYGHIPITPAPLTIKHWSTGDNYFMQGPPRNGASAELGWLRLFFNSSQTNNTQLQRLLNECQVADSCSVDDWTLRGATAYDTTATVPWKEPRISYVKSWPAIVISSLSIALSAGLLIHAMIRRPPWKRNQNTKPIQESDPSISTSSADWNSPTLNYLEYPLSASAINIHNGFTAPPSYRSRASSANNSKTNLSVIEGPSQLWL